MNETQTVARAQAIAGAPRGSSGRDAAPPFPGVPGARVGGLGRAALGSLGPLRLPESSDDTSWPSQCERLARLNHFIS
ncbi:MAG TPA: hypothetical protein VHS99_15825 [Chloroflexota bacterium]|jgi:hypothetical protein|nr:hypothetical protein [Chloroflexota bacterium]